MITREVIKLAEAEAARQHVGPDRVVTLLDGWAWAEEQRDRFPSVEQVLTLAGLIEPDNRGSFRLVPVTFPNGAWAASAGSVPTAVARLVDALDDYPDASEWVRAFLSIHPFTDGNGRTAWVLLHWVGDLWDKPVELPHFGW